MKEVKECLFYIDHDPPECSGTWGGAIHKGACKVNSTDCKHTSQCFIKQLYKKNEKQKNEIKRLKQEIKVLLHDCNYCKYRSFKESKDDKLS